MAQEYLPLWMAPELACLQQNLSSIYNFLNNFAPECTAIAFCEMSLTSFSVNPGQGKAFSRLIPRPIPSMLLQRSAFPATILCALDGMSSLQAESKDPAWSVLASSVDAAGNLKRQFLNGPHPQQFLEMVLRK